MQSRVVVALAAVCASAGLARAEPHRYPSAGAILIDPARSPYRVHVERMGEVSLVPGGATSAGGGHQLDVMLEVPVVEERAARVRAVIEHDDARMLVWIDTADLAWSIARPVRLAGRGDTGVWLNTGAPVAIAPAGRRRAVTYEDAQVTLHGTVAADAVARVFPVSRGLRASFGVQASELRSAPGGAVLHAGAVAAEVVLVRGAWTEVEYRSRYVRIRGWAAADHVEDGGFGTFGTGNGSGFGMSDTDRVLVPAGACLFDGQGGQLVGVQLATDRRYVAGHDGDWWQLYIGTPWGTILAWAHVTGDDGAGAPTWDRCAPASSAPPAADDDAP